MNKFFICKICGNFVVMIEDSGVPMVCCGQNMTELTANTVEASVEKHLPVYTMSGDVMEVQVGSELHPMIEAHHITFIFVETEKGGQIKKLKVEGEPKASFSFADDKPVAIYEYCNLHGLWKTDIK